MRKWPLILAAIPAAAGISLWNYRRYVPKPKALSDTAHRVTVQKHPISVGNHTLYGELLLPEGIPGKLPTIICSHGYNGSYHYFKDSVGMSMAMSGYAVYCFDFYGGSAHGKSGGTLEDLMISSEIADLNTVIAEIKRLPFVDLDRLYLWGESQGGFVTGLTAAQHTEDIAALVLFYPAFCAPEDLRKRFPAKADIPEAPRIFGKRVSKTYCEELFDLDAYATIAAFKNPVLVIHGDADRTVSLSYGQLAAETYPNARMEVLTGEDHGFSAKGKQKATESVYRFLENLVPSKEQNE